MTCSKYPPILSRFLDGELSPQEMADVEDHLSECEDCRALKKGWQLQGVFLRSFLERHRLGDSFVKQVMQSVSVQSGANAMARRAGTRRRPLLRLLQVAAAVAMAAVAVSLYFSSRQNVGYARVVDPCELEVLQSGSWVKASAGELLHAGDWLRNPRQGAPEILWKDTCRFTLDAGTLAHFPAAGNRAQEHVVLITGSIASDVPEGSREFQVSTPAGSVTSTLGSFTVRVIEHALTRLVVSQDGKETLNGTIVPVGEVRVGGGKALVSAAQTTHEVPAGTTAVFSGSDFSSASTPADAVDASLRVVSNSAEQGSIRASLHSNSESVWLSIEATNISIKKLLEFATGSEVRGGESTNVTGFLRLPAHPSPESVAAAAGSVIGLPISYRQEKGSGKVAAGHLSPIRDSERIPGEFALEKLPSGRVSFNFRSVPAGQVFRILRSTVSTLPEISAETAAMPVSIQGSGLSPEEIPSWLEKALGLEFKTWDHNSDVIEIGVPGTTLPPAGAAHQEPPQAPNAQVLPIGRLSAAESRQRTNEPGASQDAPVAVADSSEVPAMLGQKTSGRPLWSIIDARINVTQVRTWSAAAGGSQSAVNGKASQKKIQFFGAEDLIGAPEPSMHLVWPTLGPESALGAEAAYVVTNPVRLTAHSVWHGYDQAGRLIAQYEIEVGGSTSLTLLPNRDLPSYLGAGGHWETFSNLPLVGSREIETGNGLGWPEGSARLNRSWGFPSAVVNQGARLWVVNTEAEPASVLLVMTKNGTAIATELLRLAPHSGMIWPEAGGGVAGGMTVLVSVPEGRIAAGLR